MNSVPGELKIVRTADGSDTLFSERFNQHYHSVFGAITESKHIFIENGFVAFLESHVNFCSRNEIKILEAGLGTGLNCLMTWQKTHSCEQKVHYTAIEPFPPSKEVWQSLTFPGLFSNETERVVYQRIHEADSERDVTISDHFILNKITHRLEQFSPGENLYHLIYFDAFSPDVQPELWTDFIFRKMFGCLLPGGILVSYCVKGSVVRAMKAAGFFTEKLPGPPGKRHIIRAIKPSRY